MRTSMEKEFLKNNRNNFFLGVLVFIQAADLFAIHLFVNRRFLDYGKIILAMIRSPGLQYRTEAYYQALRNAALLLSLLIGGALVFTVIRLSERLAVEFQLIDRAIYAGAVPLCFLAVHLLAVLALWIFNKNVYEWLCPLLAYAAGTGVWALFIRKKEKGQET